MAKKELNTEALAICNALKIAISLDKDANCVTHDGKLITATPVGTLYVPVDITVGSAFKAIDMYNALNGCDKPFTHVEDSAKSTLQISWGRKRATLKTLPKVSVFVSPIDYVQNAQISEGYKEALNDFVNDLIPRSNDVSSAVVAFSGYEAYWTNRQIAAKLYSATYVPEIMAYVADLKVVTAIEGNIVGIGGTDHSVTFHFDTGTAIQIPLVDKTLVYPLNALQGLFKDELFGATYPITEEISDAIAYVSKFADSLIYLSPEHIGTHKNPSEGTAVTQDEIPLDLCFMLDMVKLGAFKKAESLTKPSHPSPTVGFYTNKKNAKFCFVAIKEQAQ